MSDVRPFPKRVDPAQPGVRRPRYACLWEEEGGGAFNSWRSALAVVQRANGSFVVGVRQTAIDDTYGTASVYRSRPFWKPERLIDEIRKAAEAGMDRAFSPSEMVRVLSRLIDLDPDVAGSELRRYAKTLASPEGHEDDLLPD